MSASSEGVGLPPGQPDTSRVVLRLLFFFQAEDGIRDIGVTGVQTCALPICVAGARAARVYLNGDHGRAGRARRSVCAGVAMGAAVLLGAVLAPTDPVLASE